MAIRPEQRRVTLDIWPHPLTDEGRDTRLLTVDAGVTLAELLPEHGDVAVEVDGAPVASDAWTRPLHSGAVVVLRPVGGDGLRTILQLATIVAAIYVPTLGPIAAQSAWVGRAVGAGIMIGGNLVTNALVPPRAPELAAQQADDPVYSLAAGANRARPWEPMALVLGRHRIYPDLAGPSYSEVRGTDQYLLQIFDFGLGDLAVTDLQIGDTALMDYQDVDLDWGLAAGAVENVEGDAHTLVVGVQLEWNAMDMAADPIIRRSSPAAQRLAVTLSGFLFSVGSGGGVEQQAMSVEIGYRPVDGEEEWTSQTYEFSHAARSPYRITISVQLPAVGQYDVRLKRTAAPPADVRRTAQMSWTILMTFQEVNADYAGRNRLGVVIRASAQLSGILDRLSAMVSQKVPVWDAMAAAWTAPRITSNPAWIFRWLALGVWIGTEAEGDRRLIAGVGLPADLIDDDALKLWGAWCDMEELQCNYVVHGETQQRILETIAQCGRATLSWAGGRLGVIWDAADRPATALVTPANIVAGSYRTQWSGEAVADEIVGRYVDAAEGFERRTVRRIAPGATAVRMSVTIDLPGVTSRAQAMREVNLQAARQVYHRRRHEWEMPINALAAGRGAVVYVTHSLIDGGQTGRLAAIGPGDEVTLSEPVTLDAEPHLLVSLPDGLLYQSTALQHPLGVGASSDRLLLTPMLPAPPTGTTGTIAWDPLDCLWRYYAGALTSTVRIVAITPADDGIVRVAAIDETALYYAAKDLPGDVPLPLPTIRIPTILDARVTTYYAVEDRGHLADINLALTVAGDWRGGVVYVASDSLGRRLVARMVDGDDTASWLEPIRTTRTITITVVPGTVAAPIGRPYSPSLPPHPTISHCIIQLRCSRSASGTTIVCPRVV